MLQLAQGGDAGGKGRRPKANAPCGLARGDALVVSACHATSMSHGSGAAAGQLAYLPALLDTQVTSSKRTYAVDKCMNGCVGVWQEALLPRNQDNGILVGPPPDVQGPDERNSRNLARAAKYLVFCI